MSWWKRRATTFQSGSVLFRGRWVARPEDFASLERVGIRIGAPARNDDGGWSLPLEHRAWGRATLEAFQDPPIPPEIMVNHDARLNDDEKGAVRGAGYAVFVRAEPRTGNVLTDRKDLLHFLHAAMLDEGIAVLDHSAQAFWSRGALEEELAHDAELDIDAIHTIHFVREDEGKASADEPRAFWLHTHGLQEIGFEDFDVLDPADALGAEASELSRALAFAVVEGRLGPGAGAFALTDGHPVRTVPAREFLARAPKSDHRLYRDTVDDVHVNGHAIVCDPAPGGLLSRLVRGAAPRAARFLRGPFPDELLIHFSTAATELMAKRARQMLPVFRALSAELAEFEFPALAKLGYRIDGGEEGASEHLWFQVHGFDGEALDATLLNAPFRIACLQEGQRGSHPLELLSDWAILTPLGSVTPRDTRTLRFIRENRARLREVVAAARAESR